MKDSRRAAGNEGTYQDHVRQQEVAYVVEFEAFERGLTPEQRALLQGAAAPDLEDHRTMNTRRAVIGVDRDVADSYAASEWSADFLDSEQDKWREEFPGLSEAEAERLEQKVCGRVEREAEEKRASDLLGLISVLLDCTNLRMQAAALAFAAGLPSVNGFHTMADWAAANGVTRAAISKVAKIWQRRLNLPPGPHLREEKLCEVYAEAQKNNHWRNRHEQ